MSLNSSHNQPTHASPHVRSSDTAHLRHHRGGMALTSAEVLRWPCIGGALERRGRARYL